MKKHELACEMQHQVFVFLYLPFLPNALGHNVNQRRAVKLAKCAVRTQSTYSVNMIGRETINRETRSEMQIQMHKEKTGGQREYSRL